METEQTGISELEDWWREEPSVSMTKPVWRDMDIRMEMATR